jgi:hypothetical protein
MSRPALEVQLCVLARTARRYGPHPTWDLLGVDFTRTVPPDTEFPRTIPRLDLLVRFLKARMGPTDIAARVWWLHPDGTSRELTSHHVFPVSFDPAERVREEPFRLINVHLPGEGLYAVRVCRRVRHRWKGMRWRVLGADYFRVVR